MVDVETECWQGMSRRENLQNNSFYEADSLEGILHTCSAWIGVYDKKLELVEKQFLRLHLENRKELEENQERIERLSKYGEDSVSQCSWPYVFGIPYFRDRNHFPSPCNKDAVDVMSKDYITDLSMPSLHQWKEQDKKNLIRAVKNELENFQKIASPETKFWKDKPYLTIPEHFDNILECDWVKIANVYMKDRHNLNECIAMWYNCLDPKLNRGSWSKKEDEKLAFLSQKHNYEDWDAIAKELGTNRSPFQCFSHHQTNLNKNVAKKKWTKEENKTLEALVSHFKIGNFIPWNKVASCMEGRTKFQVYNHWAYTLHPNIKKGRFTRAEDAIILRGVKKFGTDYGRISRFLPHRTSIQIRNRFNTFLQYQKPFKSWNPEEDAKLVDLVNTLGKGNWSQISKYFENRNRTQVRHRYAAIQNWCKKNPGKELTVNYRKPMLGLHGPQEMLEEIENNNFKNASFQTFNYVNRSVSQVTICANEISERNDCSSVEVLDKELEQFFACSSWQHGIYQQARYSLDEICHCSVLLKMLLNVVQSHLDVTCSLRNITVTGTDKRILNFLKTIEEICFTGQLSSPISSRLRSKRKTSSLDEDKLCIGADCCTLPVKINIFPPSYTTLIAFKLLTLLRSKLENASSQFSNKNLRYHDQNENSNCPEFGRNVNLRDQVPLNNYSHHTYDSNTSLHPDVRKEFLLWKKRLRSLFMWPMLMSVVRPGKINFCADKDISESITGKKITVRKMLKHSSK